MEFIQKGEEAAREAIPKIQKIFSGRVSGGAISQSQEIDTCHIDAGASSIR